MKYLPIIAGAFLGLLFFASGIVVLFNLVPTPPPPPAGSPPAMFMGAFATTGYLTFVKVFEVLGGILVAIPKTRNLGLLVLGPIIVNIFAFHLFITRGEGLFSASLLIIVALVLYLLWVERRAFAGLIRRIPNHGAAK